MAFLARWWMILGDLCCPQEGGWEHCPWRSVWRGRRSLAGPAGACGLWPEVLRAFWGLLTISYALSLTKMGPDLAVLVGGRGQPWCSDQSTLFLLSRRSVERGGHAAVMESTPLRSVLAPHGPCSSLEHLQPSPVVTSVLWLGTGSGLVLLDRRFTQHRVKLESRPSRRPEDGEVSGGLGLGAKKACVRRVSRRQGGGSWACSVRAGRSWGPRRTAACQGHGWGVWAPVAWTRGLCCTHWSDTVVGLSSS